MSKFFDDLNKKYIKKGFDKKPSIFAEWVIQYLPKQGKILELGAGPGQDGIFFAQKGYELVSTDIAESSLENIKKNIPKNLQDKISVQELDISKPFKFEDESFDIVYAHLSVHYFDKQTTKKVFSEMHRILKQGGIIALLCNSTSDPEYDTGEKIEDYYFEFEEGLRKRYFDVESMKDFAHEFKTIILDNQGDCYKDYIKGVRNLIRFVGKK